MIGLLIVAHGNLGESLIDCATHVLGKRPEALSALDLRVCEDPAEMVAMARQALAALDSGEGVLVLTDIYGATPCNALCSLIEPGRVELVAGVNLPMLLKALNYRNEGLPGLVDRAMQGGHNGVFHVVQCHA